MRKLMLVLGVSWVAMELVAMPTNAQLQKVRPAVEEIMAGDYKAAMAGKKSPVEVAATAVENASQATDEASAYLFYVGAFGLYIKGGDYDKAAEVFDRLLVEVKDIPDKTLADLLRKSLRSVPANKAEKIKALRQKYDLRVSYAARLEKGKALLKKTPSDRTLKIELAVCCVALGDWKAANEYFMSVPEYPSGVYAAKEAKGGAALLEAADFWWGYQVPGKPELQESFKAHAAVLYSKVIEEGLVGGTKRLLIEKRIAEMGPVVKAAQADVANLGMASDGKPAAGAVGKPLASFGAQSITLTLPGSAGSMEFIYVKPGEVERPLDVSATPKTVKSRISYPYWVAKRPLTWKQLEQVGLLPPSGQGWGFEQIYSNKLKYERGYTIPKEVEAAGFATPSRANISSLDKDMWAWRKQFAAELPSHYTLRLPSDAEWMRVLFLGHGKSILRRKFNPACCPTSQEIAEFLKKYGSAPARNPGAIAVIMGARKPDALGLECTVGYGSTLVEDIFTDQQMVLRGGAGVVHCVERLILDYPSKDPFFYSEDKDRIRILVGYDYAQSKPLPVLFGNPRVGPMFSPPGMVRLVIGPDLVAQWNAQHKAR